MNTIGFPISHKENERRRALIPADVRKIKYAEQLFFEEGYGCVLGYSDNDYIAHGANIAPRKDILKKNIICDPKIGDGDYIKNLKNQTIFGWVHAVQNKDITDILISRNLTVYAWEDMFEQGRHIFFRNNEIAGEAAVLHSFQCYGEMPYNMKVALIGRGNVANGALKILTMLGADITVYTRKTEELLREELSEFDVIVNGVLWDVERKDHIIYRSDLARMKKNALIIDISCDRNGGIETCIPTSIDNPVYSIDGIMHYAVDHTPSLFFRTSTRSLSEIMVKYLPELIIGNIGEVLKGAKIFNNGKILDERINMFQGR